jgi:serine/threonine protein kinase
MDMELADFTLKDYIKYVFQEALLPTVSMPSSASSTLPPFESNFNRALAERNSPINIRLQTMWTIALHICNGIKFMHECGLVHRDIKPQNSKCESPSSTNFSPLLSK